MDVRGKKADKKKKTQKSLPELRDLVRVFLGFSPEVRVNFRQFFSFYRLLGHPNGCSLTFRSWLFFFNFFLNLLFCAFAFLFRGFQGFCKEKSPWFLVVGLAFFFQKARVGGSGLQTITQT